MMKVGVKGLGVFAIVALTALVFQGCGSDKKDENTSTDTGSTDFAKDIKPILDKACATAGCHATNQTGVDANAFTDGTRFKASGSLASINNGSMPSGTPVWTSTEKAKVVAYLGSK